MGLSAQSPWLPRYLTRNGPRLPLRFGYQYQMSTRTIQNHFIYSYLNDSNNSSISWTLPHPRPPTWRHIWKQCERSYAYACTSTSTNRHDSKRAVWDCDLKQEHPTELQTKKEHIKHQYCVENVNAKAKLAVTRKADTLANHRSARALKRAYFEPTREADRASYQRRSSTVTRFLLLQP